MGGRVAPHAQGRRGDRRLKPPGAGARRRRAAGRNHQAELRHHRAQTGRGGAGVHEQPARANPDDQQDGRLGVRPRHSQAHANGRGVPDPRRRHGRAGRAGGGVRGLRSRERADHPHGVPTLGQHRGSQLECDGQATIHGRRRPSRPSGPRCSCESTPARSANGSTLEIRSECRRSRSPVDFLRPRCRRTPAP